MKSLIAFSHVLLKDLEQRCGVSAPRDHKRITSRIEHEGLSFLTITLPAYGKDFDRSLSLGKIDDDLFTGYQRRGGIPIFLGDFLRLVFDPCTGRLLDVPSIDAIISVRQLCAAFQKIQLPCADRREKAAIDGYIKCEMELTSHADTGRDFASLGARIFGSVLSRVDRAVFDGNLIPRHGPGVTADRLLGNSKYDQPEWTVRLEEMFPYADFALPSHRWWENAQTVEYHEPGAERPVKVITVPKTLKTPRIIAVEPTCMQYMQQALARLIVDELEKDDDLSPLIGFTDQGPNRSMACEGSITGSLATLDLSEASDRVLNQHVVALFSRFPSLCDGIQACRTTKADVPGHGVIPLAKFASMGSGLCFPVEAMVFLSIIVDTIASCLNRPVTRQLVHELQGRVRVYGDDIIVPVEFARAVEDALESEGLKVNHNKSFLTGNFRESCGGDFYNGTWVTPVRVRRSLPTTAQHVAEIVSAVSLRNQLFVAGYTESVGWLDQLIGGLLPVYPLIPVGHPGLGRWTWDPVMGPSRDGLYKPFVKVCTLSSRIPASRLDGPGALMKFFLHEGDDPLPEDAFIRAGRPLSVRIKTRWLPVDYR